MRLSKTATQMACLFACLVIGIKNVRAEGATAAIELTSPKGGETWAAGSYHHITWQTDQPVSIRNMRAEFTSDDGGNWVKIKPAIPSPSRPDARLLWRVPDETSAQCRIRVSNPSRGISIESQSFSIVPSQAMDYAWDKVTSRATFAPRDGAGSLVFKDRMWLLGGWNPGDKVHFPRITNNEVWSSADGVHWNQVKPNTFLDSRFDPTHDWEGRHTGGYVVYRDAMWLVGGDANLGHYQFDVWNSSDGVNWNYVNEGHDVPWGQRMLHHTLVFQDKIWVMGGQAMPVFVSSQEAFYRDIWNTTDGVNWRQVKPEEPYWSARGIIMGSVVFNDRMWILGGGTYDTPQTPTRQMYNDVWSSADGVHWECHVEYAPWSPRQYHYVTVFDDRMWVLGGFNNGDRNDVWYSSDGVNWYMAYGTPWKGRHAASVYVYDDALWITAGSAMSTDVWRLRRDSQPNKLAQAAGRAENTTDVVIVLNGFDYKATYIYDADNPEMSSYPVNITEGNPVLTRIYASVFGINFLDDQGKNVYAQLSVDAKGNVRFDKWNDGGDGMKLSVDNKPERKMVIITETGR